jgi:hypothetical protein
MTASDIEEETKKRVEELQEQWSFTAGDLLEAARLEASLLEAGLMGLRGG